MDLSISKALFLARDARAAGRKRVWIRVRLFACFSSSTCWLSVSSLASATMPRRFAEARVDLIIF